MKNVVVAYISVASFRGLPQLKGVLGPEFEPSGTFFERALPDEPSAERARDQLFEIGRWGPFDNVFIETADPVKLDIGVAHSLAASDEQWKRVLGAVDPAEVGNWKLDVAVLKRCVAILVRPPVFSIGGGAGFLVDHEHRIVLPREHREVAEAVRGHEIVASTIGEFTSQLQRRPEGSGVVR